MRKSMSSKDFVAAMEGADLKNEVSPLRQRKMKTTEESDTPILENDDEVELSNRRKSMMERRKSIGVSRVAQMPEAQMEEQMKQCIQLNTENKINVKNAFKFDIIDILACIVKRNSNLSTLQVASSSLDVSHKIYGLRVDQVHTEVLKVLGVVDKQEKEAQKDEENESGAEEQSEMTEMEKKKKKRKKKRTTILSRAENLVGSVELTSPESLMMQEGDPQTSDMLYQTTLPIGTENLYYLIGLNPAVDEPRKAPPGGYEVKQFANCCVKSQRLEDLDISAAFKNFAFRKWDEEYSNEKQVNLEQHERSIFQFDPDASLPADGAEFMDNDFRDNEADPAVFLTNNISSGIKLKTLEYSYVPTHEVIRWAGPSYWKIRVSNRNTMHNKLVNVCANAKQTSKKKNLVLEFNNESVEDARVLLKFSRSTQLTSKTTKSWDEDKLMINDNVWSNNDSCSLYKYRLRPESNIKVVRCEDANTTHLDGIEDEIIYDYNNALDTSEYCPNVEENEDILDTEDKEIGKLTGDNLVEMPDLVGNTFIPYSKKAKKIDVGQLKKSIWKTITKNVKKDKEENKKDTIEAQRQFSEIYHELPQLLTKSNLEALSTPVCFVSLLHLANEKSLRIEESADLANLNVSTY